MSFHPNDIVRRARGAWGLLAVTFVLLLSAFFRTQVLQHETYAVQSTKNRLRPIPIPAPRGIILDRNGKTIAENLPAYSVSVTAPTVDSLQGIMRRLAEAVPITPDQMAAAQRRFNQAPGRPTVVLPDAPIDVVAVLEEHRIDYPELVILSVPKRYYPDAEAVAPFIGYTGEISERELAQPEFVGYKPGQVIGKGGLEKEYEKQLHGQEGMQFEEVDARGRRVGASRNGERRRALGPEMPEAPPPLQTTIDLDLQQFTRALFGDSLQGGVIAVDPKTGEVLTIYSNPSYDPNKFTGSIPAALWKELNNDPRRPLYNKVLQGTYPPGSTWKLATAVLGLEQGAVGINERMPIPCTGGMQYGNRYWRCWEKRGHGSVDLAGAIKVSCDVYFYQLGARLSLNTLIAGGVKLGFRDLTGIDLPYESRPRFPAALDYTKEQFGATKLVPSDALNIAIGQGTNSQTVANMARFYTALAAGGDAAQLHLVKKAVSRKKLFRLSAEQRAALEKGLVEVILPGGTAASAALRGVTLGGKTGTSQNPHGDDHAWFVGVAPMDDPKIVVAVMLEFGGHGYRAARIAAAMIAKYLGTTLASAPPSAVEE
jgi:penicillin-binding protein 2